MSPIQPTSRLKQSIQRTPLTLQPAMDSNQNSSAIIIGNCLQCKGMVRIPSNSDPKSQVRCPHCSSTFTLQKIVEEAVPELEVVTEQIQEEVIPHVDRGSNSVQKSDNNKFIVPSQLSDGARHRKRRKSSKGSKSANSESRRSRSQSSRSQSGRSQPGHSRSNGVASERDRATSVRQSSSSQQRSSGRRKKSKPQQEPGRPFEFFKILIGGLLAFPVAYLLVFWGFKQDPLGLAPAISNVIPAIVPAELRGEDATVENVEEDADADSDTGEAEFDKNELPVPNVDPELRLLENK